MWPLLHVQEPAAAEVPLPPDTLGSHLVGAGRLSYLFSGLAGSCGGDGFTPVHCSQFLVSQPTGFLLLSH